MEKPGRRYLKFLSYSALITWGVWLLAIGILAIQFVWPHVPSDVRDITFYVSLGSGGLASIFLVALLFALWDLAWYNFHAWRQSRDR